MVHAIVDQAANSMTMTMTQATQITEIPTIIDPSAAIKYPSATGSIIVGISVLCGMYISALYVVARRRASLLERKHVLPCLFRCLNFSKC
jgi:hypothetical protein